MALLGLMHKGGKVKTGVIFLTFLFFCGVSDAHIYTNQDILLENKASGAGYFNEAVKNAEGYVSFAHVERQWELLEDGSITEYIPAHKRLPEPTPIKLIPMVDYPDRIPIFEKKERYNPRWYGGYNEKHGDIVYSPYGRARVVKHKRSVVTTYKVL
jgi:hypothetical protein